MVTDEKVSEIVEVLDNNNIKVANDITRQEYFMSIVKYCIENNQTECLFKNFSRKIGTLTPELRLKLFKILIDNENNVCCRLAAQIYYTYLHDYDAVHTIENDEITDVDFQIKYLVLKYGDDEENVPKRKLMV